MQIAKMIAANQYLGTVFLWIHSGLFKKSVTFYISTFILLKF